MALMNMKRRSVLQFAGASVALGVSQLNNVFAQSLPDTARIVSGFAVGGTTDTFARRVAANMTGHYAKNVFVETKTGAGGQIAIQYTKGQPADGLTLVSTPMSMLGIYPHIYKRLPYDAATDVVPVSLGCMLDMGFAVGPSVPESVKTIKEYLEWVKGDATRASFGSPAPGSIPHFVGILIGRQEGVALQHVGYRGTNPAIQDMMGGQIPAVSGPLGDFLPFVETGKCRLLSSSGRERSRFTPNVKTLYEQGYKDLVFNEWFGIFAPGNTSRDAINRANKSVVETLANPEVIKALAAMGLEAKSSTPDELAAILRADTERWGPIVKSIGFTADS